MKKRRLYRTIWGVPIWMIIGGSLFVIFSVIYDAVVGDRNAMRYAVLIVSIVMLVIAILFQFATPEAIGRSARKQMGG